MCIDVIFYGQDEEIEEEVVRHAQIGFKEIPTVLFNFRSPLETDIRFEQVVSAFKIVKTYANFVE